jgi:hypothetical protein
VAKKKPFDASLMPVPTHWTKRTPEGPPKAGVLLLLKGERIITDGEDFETQPIVELGYWSDKVNAYVTLDSMAFEEQFDLVAFHIVHDLDGEPYDID